MSLRSNIRRTAANYDHCFGNGSAAREVLFVITFAIVLFFVVALVVAAVRAS